MPFLLSIGFFAFALFFASIGNGLLAAFFLIISLIAYMNHNGGGPSDDDQRPA